MFPRLLALEGFKSFPEWNGLELSPGISVLVGLNGTGKSNVTDAISWHRPPPTLERLLLLEPAERRRTIEEAAGIPHVSVQAAALSAERDDLRLEREHVAGELEHARRTLPGLEEEDLQLQLARRLDAALALARSRALEAVHAACVPAGTDLEELLELLGLPAVDRTGQENGGRHGSDWADRRPEAVRLAQERAAMGEVNLRADTDLKRMRAEVVSLERRSEELETACNRVEAETRAVRQIVQATFSAVLVRVEQRFRAYYALLAPGGEAGLPLVDNPGDPAGSGVEVVARPPGKLLDRVNSLSGGERSLAALSFALALFQEYASPLIILDEVEPALDDANIRRLQAVLDLVAGERQLIVVSHQQRAKETGDVVFGVERNLDGASQIKFRYEPAGLRLEVFRRTWAAQHLRRDAAQAARPTTPRDTRPTVEGR